MTAAERVELRQRVDQAVRARVQRAGNPYRPRTEQPWRKGRLPGRCALCGYWCRDTAGRFASDQRFCRGHSWANELEAAA